jgi:hypothetical protein
VPALALVAGLAIAWPTSASAQPVVSATVYPSTGGPVTHPVVGRDALDPCPGYAGPNPIYLYPPLSGNPVQITQTSWLLSTVISCGLQVPLIDVNSVQILNPTHGFEDPLSNADLTDPTRYQASGALPVISVDGTEDQTTYLRPYRGAGDANAGDQVTETGNPITLVVYAHGPPLIVHVSAQTLSSTATATMAKLSATVKTAAGVTLSASALTWSWNFGDGTTSTAAAPEHRFASGSYPVAVQVSEINGGNGGTSTFKFQTPAKPTSGHKNQPGGTKRTESKSSTGTDNGKHSKHQGGQAGSHQSAGSGVGTSTTPSQSTATTPSTTQPTTGTASAATPPPATTIPTTTTTTPHRTAPRRPKATAPPARTGPLVTGRLVSDVVPLSAGSSPLVRATPAAAAPPQVRQATRSRSLAAPGAGLAVALLLGLGAWWELRGRRRWRAVFPGH